MNQLRRATNVELFLDLLFVFAVTQVARQVTDHPTVVGALQGVLLAWQVWWLWSQFVWLGTAVDLERDRRGQFVVLLAAVPTLAMTVGLSDVFLARCPWYGVGYVVAQAVPLGALWLLMRRHHESRREYWRYAAPALVQMALVLGGSLVAGWGRWAAWGVALVLSVVGAQRTGRNEQDQATWSIDPAHFAERHALFVIIALGEVLVGLGGQLVGHRSGWTVLAALAAVGLAVALWFVYFSYLPRVVEHALAGVSGAARSRRARDLCSFGHFPLVLGVICVAVAGSAAVGEPSVRLAPHPRWLLAAGMALFVGGLMLNQWRFVRTVSPERVAGLAGLVAVVAGLGAVTPAPVPLFVGAAILGAMHTITLRRINAD